LSFLNFGDFSTLVCGCWNPYFVNQVTVSTGNTIIGCDTRQKSTTFTIGPKAHGSSTFGGSTLVRDIDINPNNPNFFVTGGDDYKIKFWDQRNTSKPLQKVLTKHSHWVWKVQYNPNFDSLVISSSSDGTVNLWNVSSLSFRNPHVMSNTSTTVLDLNTNTDSLDRLLKTYEDHEDSIYSICWSKCSDRTWDWASFASLSYDGRVVINRVPEKEARKVLGT